MTTEDYVALVIEVPKAHAVYLAEPNEENFLRWYEGSKALSIVRAERVASRAPMVDEGSDNTLSAQLSDAGFGSGGVM